MNSTLNQPLEAGCEEAGFVASGLALVFLQLSHV